MPLRATELIQWSLKATLCVGHIRIPDVFEWDLSPAALLTSLQSIWNIRPQGTSATNWTPIDRGAVFSFEWIAFGCTANCFWTAPNPFRAGKPGEVQNFAPLD